MKQLEQAYQIAGSKFSLRHPLTFAAQLAIATAKAKTDISAAAADFASLDHDMIDWNSAQIGTANSRVVAEASRALADEMLYAYARLCRMRIAAAVPAFADAVRRWPTLEDGKRDTLRKLMRLIAPDDLETRRLLQKAMRISYAYQAVASSGEDFETQGQPLLIAIAGDGRQPQQPARRKIRLHQRRYGQAIAAAAAIARRPMKRWSTISSPANGGPTARAPIRLRMSGSTRS